MPDGHAAATPRRGWRTHIHVDLHVGRGDSGGVDGLLQKYLAVGGGCR